MLVLIDNYDSFTFNLLHYLGELGEEVKVLRNDALTVQEVLAFKPQRIVLSPGPCTPNEAGICLALIRTAAEYQIPVLGVCLGHQAIAQAFGAKIIRGTKPMHGKITPISHHNEIPFNNIPNPLHATRYHSLIVERQSLPECLLITAEDEESTIMGLRHRCYPLYGVQFHPESVASEHGHAILNNFIKIAKKNL